ncbi:MAG: transcription elongation factor GreA [Patescibacteria group bacterium]
MSQKQFVTAEGLEKLHAELHQLKTAKRKELAGRIQDAKELGDLSENAEYQEAKNEQSFVEGRIAEIESMLKNIEVINHTNSGIVQVGSTIDVEFNGKKQSFTIVGSNETDPSAGRISNASPLGQAFLGHKAGDTANVKTPMGTITATILSIR